MEESQGSHQLPSRFRCQGKIRTGEWRLNPGGIVETGELERLINGENPVDNLEIGEYLEIYGEKIRIVSADELISEEKNIFTFSDLPQISILVAEVLKNYGLLETYSINSGTIPKYSELKTRTNKIQNDIATCLSFLKYISFTLRTSKVEYGEFLKNIISDILLSQERLADFPSEHLVGPAKCDILHTWLEIRWCLIVLVSYLKEEPEDSLVQTNLDFGEIQLSWMEQILFATMLDLTEIFSKRLSIEAVGRTSLLFGCVCIDELWFSLCKLSQERGVDVWKLLSYMFNNNTVDLELNCGILQYTVFSSTSLQNKMLFWNLTGALINLLQVSGLRIQEADILMSYVRQELKPLLCEDQSQEVLRPVLQTLILLFKHSGPGFEILLDLWTYCSSRLNSSFKTNSNSLENAAFIPKNVVSWQNCVDDIVSGRSKHHDSFHLFLNLVAIATKAWKDTKIKNIDRFKTRIIQKLPDSKAALLSDCGIFYVGTLFSVLVSISELDSLLPMVLGILKPALARLGASNNLRLLGLNCKLNLALCCVGSRISLKPIGESVTGQLEKLVNQYCADQLDAQHRRSIQDGIKIYLEFLEELVVECTLTQDEASFVEPWIQNYLNVCSSSEISSILATFNKVLCRCRAIYNLMEGVKITPEQTEKEKMLISFINKLFNILLPSTKRLISTLTCPLEIADVGFEFLNLTMEGAKRRQYFSESTISILQIFTSINIRDELRVEFLFRITAIPSVVEGVISTLKSSKLSEDLLLSVTGTCSLTVDPAHQSYSKLEDVWTRLSDIYGLNAKERIKYSSHVALDIMSCLAYTSHAEVLLEMCKSCESLDKNKVRPKYMFRVFGWMARDFMNIIYRPNQSNNGFLLVVSTLLTQNKFFSSTWAPTSDELEGIKIYIPLSLGSMFLHPDFPNDTALQRKSEDIIRLYLGRFRIQDHPLLFIFSKNEFKFPPGRIEFVLTLVFKVMVRLLSVETIKTLQFLRQVIPNLDTSSQQVFITQALSAVLELMFREDATVKQETKDLLKKLLPTIRKQVDSFSGLQILFDEKLLEFLRHQFPVQRIKVFSFLRELVLIDPMVLQFTLDDIKGIVDRQGEMMGTSKSWSSSYEKLVSLVKTSRPSLSLTSGVP